LLANKAIVLTVAISVLFGLASPVFFTSRNLFNVLEQVSVMTIVAVAVTMILGAGEIDLSVGAIVGLSGIVMGKLMAEAGLSMYLAIPAGVLVGALCGAINATVISTFALPPFIVTLATGSVFTGVIYVTTNLVPISDIPADFVYLGQGFVGPVPVPVILTIPVVAVIYIISKRTVFGTHVLALGGNPEAVRLAGISVARVRLYVYVLTGIYCALASVILTALSASAQIAAGSDLLLNVIAAVVIGGTPLIGGRVTVIGTVFGCLVMQIISNGLILVGINANFQIMAQGALILVALLVDVYSSRLVRTMSRMRLRSGMESAAVRRRP
jgi:ribose/xylose/arabinose/galactoside ABC-type transport system permease subunit